MSSFSIFRVAGSVAMVCVITFASLGGSASSALADVEYVDRAVSLGIDMMWSDGAANGDFGTGVAMEDFDHDGDLDLFVGTQRGSHLGVYRNDGGTFTDISGDLDLATDRHIKQILFADMDNDGWRDLILTVWNPDAGDIGYEGSSLRMYQAQPGGGFVARHNEVIDLEMAGLAVAASAGDLDRDGDLDLYISVWKPGRADSTSANRLLRNDRNWNFVDRAAALAVDDAKKSFQAVLADLSGDGWLDIVISEDKSGGVTYYENNGDGTFADRTDSSGLDGYLFLAGTRADGMGVAVADYDGDWDLDVYVTNIFDGNLLYRNNGDGSFTNVAVAAGVANYRGGWACAFFDCDNDTYQDLYVVDYGGGVLGSNLDRLFRNLGGGIFSDVAPSAGIEFPENGYGAAVGDVDGNGGLDLLLVQEGAPVRLLMNEGTFGNLVELELVGTDSNRDAIGARVTVWSGERAQHLALYAGEGYLSTHSHGLEVGLGTATVVDSVSVWWPTGQTEMWYDLAAGERHVLTEASSQVTAPLPTARWNGSAVTISWEVTDPMLWSSFELWRESPGTPVFVTSLLMDPTRTSYSLSDPEATVLTTYSLRSIRSGTNDVMTAMVAAPSEVPLSTVRLEAPRPNPFNPRVTLRFYTPESEVPSLRIIDPRGREITRLVAPVGGGWQTAVWDGTDAHGRHVASGTYYFEVRIQAEARTTPMTLVR